MVTFSQTYNMTPMMVYTKGWVVPHGYKIVDFRPPKYQECYIRDDYEPEEPASKVKVCDSNSFRMPRLIIEKINYVRVFFYNDGPIRAAKGNREFLDRQQMIALSEAEIKYGRQNGLYRHPFRIRYEDLPFSEEE